MMESRKFDLVKINRDRDSGEESFSPLSIYQDSINCLYEDGRGVYIVTKQAFMHKVPYSIVELRNLLNI